MARMWVIEKCDSASGWIRLTEEEVGEENLFKTEVQASRAMEAIENPNVLRFALRTRRLSKNGN